MPARPGKDDWVGQAGRLIGLRMPVHFLFNQGFCAALKGIAEHTTKAAQGKVLSSLKGGAALEMIGADAPPGPGASAL